MARVLLVDDEPALLFTLSQLLKSRGLEPVLARSAK
jgi:CheY-like chemotaxis protein